MNSVSNVVFSNVIKHDPEPEDAGMIIITANIIGRDVNLTFTTISLIEEFIDDENNECVSKQDVNYFLMEARIDYNLIWDAIYSLINYVDEITNGVSSEDLRSHSLEVGMDFLLSEDDDSQIEEAVQDSLNQTNNIRFRPTSKLVVNSLVKSLTRKIYNKTSSLDGDKCTICLKEFNDGTRVVTLPCGHDQFDDDYLSKWFETNHVCPLCRSNYLVKINKLSRLLLD